MLIARRIVPLMMLIGLAILAYYSILSALADVSFRENNLAALRIAVALVPANAAYHALLAEHQEAAGENPDRELEIATELSPRESRYWVRRSFRAEIERNYADSEKFLVTATRVDRGFDPRWALMNFYFRRGRTPEFWKAAKEALEMSYDDLSPIFRLCLATNDDPQATRLVLPARRGILRAFFVWLIQNRPVESSKALADELASSSGPEDLPALADYCDRQLGRDNESALAVWNTLCRRKLLPFRELAPGNGLVVTNGNFSAEPSNRGFDWRFGADQFAVMSRPDGDKGISIDINGRQPDRLILLEEDIPLSPGRKYAVTVDYDLAGDQSDSGLHLLVAGGPAGETNTDDPIATSAVFSTQDQGTERITFQALKREVARLQLEYRRTAGTIRWKGAVRVHRVISALAQPLPAESDSIPLRAAARVLP